MEGKGWRLWVRVCELEVGGWRLEVGEVGDCRDGGWRWKVGGWRWLVRGWRLEVGDQGLEVGGWRLEVGSWSFGG